MKRQTIYLFILLLILSYAVYGNSIRNQFAVVDDLSTVVNNPFTKDINGSFRSLEYQKIIPAISYHFFGMTPVPLRIVAITLHAVVALLIYSIVKELFTGKVAFPSAVLFLVHPVTTETLNWISAQSYIAMAVSIFSSLLLYIHFKKTKKKRYLLLMTLVYGTSL